MKPKRRVVVGILGPMLDRGVGPKRWEQWRPTVALCQHEDLLVERLELLYENRFSAIADRVIGDISSVSPETRVVRHLVDWSNPWDFESVYSVLHDFARNYVFDTDGEEYLVHLTTGTHVAQICMFLLIESRHIPGKILQTSPPRRSDEQGPGEFTVVDLDLARYDRIASRFRLELREGLDYLKSGIVTKNAAFNRLISRIERVVTQSKSPILLTGPTGAGKSLLARRIYELKRSRHQIEGAFVDVNCATIRGDAAMSALFGHVKGAFTGAVQSRPGLLRAARGGMLFLDEVGELGLDEQAMLLRALEEKRFLPVGADDEEESDFQLIAGTNRDLWASVRDGSFREDLLARINLWTFRLPGLRERPEDIEPNLAFELEAYARTNNSRVTMNREAHRKFIDFAISREALWTANFREFNASVTRMATLATGGRITVEIVDEEIGRLQESWRSLGAPNELEDRDAGDGIDPLDELLGTIQGAELDRFDRVQLADVVRVCRDARTLSDAGRELFGASRLHKRSANDADRLRKYLARFGLTWGRVSARHRGTKGVSTA